MSSIHPRLRKVDAILVIAVILTLWGPGFVIRTGSMSLPLNLGTSQGEAEFRSSSPCAKPETVTGKPAEYPRLATAAVTITGYGSRVEETDDTPDLTATNTKTRTGVIALSQDLLVEFTPGAPFAFHDVVEVPNVGRFSVEDTMHPRWTNRADIWFETREEALTWGRQSRRIYRLPRKAGMLLTLPAATDIAAGIGKSNFQ